MSITELTALIGAAIALGGVTVTGLLTVARIGRMAGIMETSLKFQNQTIQELRAEINKIGDILTKMATATTRMDYMATQLAQITKRVDELAHGEGFVIPLTEHLPYQVKRSGG